MFRTSSKPSVWRTSSVISSSGATNDFLLSFFFFPPRWLLLFLVAGPGRGRAEAESEAAAPDLMELRPDCIFGGGIGRESLITRAGTPILGTGSFAVGAGGPASGFTGESSIYELETWANPGQREVSLGPVNRRRNLMGVLSRDDEAAWGKLLGGGSEAERFTVMCGRGCATIDTLNVGVNDWQPQNRRALPSWRRRRKRYRLGSRGVGDL